MHLLETHCLLLVSLVPVGAIEDVVHTPSLSKDGAKEQGECNASNPQAKLQEKTRS